MSNEPKVHLPLRVPESYIERLDTLADSMGLDRSEVARRAIRNGIDDLEQVSKMAGNPVMEKLLQLATLLETEPEERAEMTRVIRSMASQKKSKKRTSKRTPRTP